jgi:uncharacterized protein (DUF983 family)
VADFGANEAPRKSARGVRALEKVYRFGHNSPMKNIDIQTDVTSVSVPADRSAWPAMRRGLAHKCPACGEGDIFKSYLKVVDACAKCGEELHHHQADDAPPYFTIMIVGHIIGGGILWLELNHAPPTWVHLSIWLPLLLVLTLTMLPRIKAALVGLQWALRMHGFAVPDSASPPQSSAVATR